jgi:hypothetical protein
MKLSIETKSYNEKRYGAPYIGVVDFSTPQGHVTWGDFIGSPGHEGILEIDVSIGDVVIRGQKDNRGNNSTPAYYKVTATGELERIGVNRADAYKAFKQSDPKATLEAERAALLARIQAIDLELGKL